MKRFLIDNNVSLKVTFNFNYKRVWGVHIYACRLKLGDTGQEETYVEGNNLDEALAKLTNLVRGRILIKNPDTSKTEVQIPNDLSPLALEAESHLLTRDQLYSASKKNILVEVTNLAIMCMLAYLSKDLPIFGVILALLGLAAGMLIAWASMLFLIKARKQESD